jgi:ubiquinone/menaquinone biosynthesis C-methylase UbiE
MKEHEFTGLKAHILAWVLSGWPRHLLDRFIFGNPRPRIFELLSIKGDEIILDAGAGSGFYSLAIAKKMASGKVISVDISREMLTSLEKQAKRGHLLDYIDIRLGDCAKLPIENNTVDKAITVLVWHDMNMPNSAEVASQELYRVLKPGGKVVAVEWISKGEGHGSGHHRGFGEPFGEKEIKQILNQTGFVNEQAEVVRRLVIGYAEKP